MAALGLWGGALGLSLNAVSLVTCPSGFMLSQDSLSVWMIFLRAWVTSLIVLTQFFTGLKSYLIKVFSAILVLLIIVFRCSDLIQIYFFFEASLIPIFIIVLGWGYQPERLPASLFLFFYTLFASLPLILFIFLVLDGAGCTLIGTVLQTTSHIKGLVFLAGIVVFLVKFPVFGVHMWLPKAHVEAPVSGSMVLAGVLLKLGGYGMLRLTPLLSGGEPFLILAVIVLGGGGIIRVLCVATRDIKIVIALSSVVHMALIATILKWGLLPGREGGVIIILAHGVCSSGLFMLANSLYERSHSRAFTLNKGATTNISSVIPMFFILVMANFGGPFTLNLLGELLIIINLNHLNWGLLIAVLPLSFFSAAYRLILFSRVTQGPLLGPAGAGPLPAIRELQVVFIHCWPLFLRCAAPLFT